MSDKPVAHTEDLANTEYDGNRRALAARASEKALAAEKPTIEPVEGTDGVVVAQHETEA